MIDTKLILSRIVESIQKRGPSLPIQLAKDVGVSSLFVSAFLSELAGDKRIKISSLKVGGSPLYYVEGQESQLERFYNYLPAKEAEAFELLKKSKVLKDSDQEPSIRVALRSIKDFAISFKKDDELYWKFKSVTNNEVEDLLEPKIIKEIIEHQPDNKIIELEIKPTEQIIGKSKDDITLTLEKSNHTTLKTPDIEKIIEKRKKPEKEAKREEIDSSEKITFDNPLVEKNIQNEPKQRPKSEFVERIIRFVSKSNFRIINELDYKQKEYKCLLEVGSDLGPITFLAYSKEKKSITDKDLLDLLKEAQTLPLPALYIYTGSLSKKAILFKEKYSSILKTLKLDS